MARRYYLRDLRHLLTKDTHASFSWNICHGKVTLDLFNSLSIRISLTFSVMLAMNTLTTYLMFFNMTGIAH